MSKVYIVNGSPRKNWNTAKMCESFAEGVKSEGVEAEIINLYDVDFKGCRSCFACKLKGGKSSGKCACQDELTPLLEKISNADGLVLASPIYFGDITGVLREFVERLLFPFLQYDAKFTSVAPKKLQISVIYTMNVSEEICAEMYSDVMKRLEWFLEKMFTKPVRICAYDTYQFSDYDKYAVECFSKEHKIKQRDEQFPKDLEKAYKEGKNMAEKIL